MIYFDNAATGGRKPETVLTAATAALHLCANPGRSGHRLSVTLAQRVLSCRKLLADYFDCESYENVVFTKNCTEALNVLLFGTLRKGDHVITSCMEHNSVLRPLHRLASLGIITYDVCPLSDGSLSPQDVATRLRPTTKAVIVTAASNVTGASVNLSAIKSVLPKDVLFFCDGAQGGGHLPLKMQETGLDGLCLAGHKGLLGIAGSGVLLFSSRATPRPLLFGGTGSMSYSLDMPDFLPDALEAGTINFPAIISLFEGINHLTVHGDAISKHLSALTARAINGLQTFPKVRTYSRPNACGIIAFAHEHFPSEVLSAKLSQEYDVATRGGLHCAPLMHEALGTDDGLLRLSFDHASTEKEIDAVLSYLADIFHGKNG